MEKKEIFIPYHIEKRNDKTYIHKLVSKEEYQNLLFFKQSKYKKLDLGGVMWFCFIVIVFVGILIFS